jgi:hypothetical protein
MAIGLNVPNAPVIQSKGIEAHLLQGFKLVIPARLGIGKAETVILLNNVTRPRIKREFVHVKRVRVGERGLNFVAKITQLSLEIGESESAHSVRDSVGNLFGRAKGNLFVFHGDE